MQNKSTELNVTVKFFFFCNLGNAIINHSSYKKGQGVNESMVCFIITWRGGGKPLFRFLIVGRLAWYWYWYSLTTIPENFRKMCWVAFEKFSDKKKREKSKIERKNSWREENYYFLFIFVWMFCYELYLIFKLLHKMFTNWSN